MCGGSFVYANMHGFECDCLSLTFESWVFPNQLGIKLNLRGEPS